MFDTPSSYNSSGILYTHRVHHNMSDPSTFTTAHNTYEIIYVKSGDITYVVEEKVYYVKSNDIIITPPGKIHTLFFNDLTEYDRYDIFFDKSIVISSVYEKLCDLSDVINADHNPEIADLFKKLDYYYEKFSEEEFGNILKNITEEIVYNIILVSKNNTTAFSSNPVLKKAIRYIEENIRLPFTLEDLCGELYLTKNTIHRLFKQHLQITPKQYITVKRLELAQKKIRNGLKPTDVYTLCGFSEYSTFWRDYKKYFGYSPSEESGQDQLRKSLLIYEKSEL